MFGLEAGEMNLLGETPNLLSSPEAPSGYTGKRGVSKAKVVGICLLALAPPGELPTRTFKEATKSTVFNNQELCLVETTLPAKNGESKAWVESETLRIFPKGRWAHLKPFSGFLVKSKLLNRRHMQPSLHGPVLPIL